MLGVRLFCFDCHPCWCDRKGVEAENSLLTKSAQLLHYDSSQSFITTVLLLRRFSFFQFQQQQHILCVPSLPQLLPLVRQLCL